MSPWKSEAPQQLLYAAAVLLIVSGLGHTIIWLFSNEGWEGPVSWRKPILFGISTGLTVLSTAWLYPKLQPSKWDAFLCGLFGLAMIIEVALISIQQWRGVKSHFNHSTPLDTSIENGMTCLIIVATIILAEFTRRCFVNLIADSDLRLAIQGGMGLLMVSCLIGFAILIHGNFQAAIGANPSTFGKAGLTKFPHGVAIHAIQMFPLACWLMKLAGVPIQRRTRAIGYLIASTATFLIFSLVQTIGGRARFDLAVGGTLLLILSFVFLVPTVAEIIGFQLMKRKRRIH